MPKHLEKLFSLRQRLDAQANIDRNLALLKARAKARRANIMQAIDGTIAKFCGTASSGSLFCLLMLGVQKNFKNALKGKAFMARYKDFLGKVQHHYCSTAAQLKTHRCAIFPLIRGAKPVAKKEAKKEVNQAAAHAENLLKAISTAMKHYCNGKGKLMCQVVQDVRRFYVMSLKPGQKDALITYLRRARKNFCSGHNKKSIKGHSRKRCAMIAAFRKHARAASMRPAGSASGSHMSKHTALSGEPKMKIMKKKPIYAPIRRVQIAPTPTPPPPQSYSVSGGSLEERAKNMIDATSKKADKPS